MIILKYYITFKTVIVLIFLWIPTTITIIILFSKYEQSIKYKMNKVQWAVIRIEN